MSINIYKIDFTEPFNDDKAYKFAHNKLTKIEFDCEYKNE